MKSKCPKSSTFSRSVLSMHGHMEMARSQPPSSLLWSLVAFMAPNLFAASRRRSAELPSPAGRVTYPGHWDHSTGEAGRHSESVCALRLVLSFCSWDPETAGQPAQPSPWEERVPHHPSHCSRHMGNPSTPAGPAADEGHPAELSLHGGPIKPTGTKQINDALGGLLQQQHPLPTALGSLGWALMGLIPPGQSQPPRPGLGHGPV